MVLEVVQTCHEQDHKVVRGHAQVAADGGTVVSAVAEAVQVDAVVDDADAPGGNTLVVDQRLADGLADADHAVALFQQKAVAGPPFGPRVVREVPAVLGEQHRRPAVQEPGQQTVKERRVLMGVDEIDALAAEQRRQAQAAAPVQPGPPADHLDGKPFVAQFKAEGADLVQAGEDEATAVAKAAADPRRQDFGAADVQGVQQLTNGRSRSQHSRPSPRLFAR